jgi:hypothetical protein
MNIAPLSHVATILLACESFILLLIPAVIIGGSAYGVRWLRRKLPALFAQVRKVLALFKLYVERGGAAAVAPIIAADAAAAQLRAWWDYVAGLVREGK